MKNKITILEDKMGKYKKCPRCELNWIPTEEELCEVCKAEMGKASKISLLEEDDDIIGLGERICPICKVNYLDADEDMCQSCRAERAEKEVDKSEDDDWKEYIDDEEPIYAVDDESEMSLSQLQEEEEIDDEEEEICPDDFEELDEEDLLGFDDDEEELEEDEEE